MHLFTYGSLMFAEVWQRVVGRRFATCPADLRGYEIFRVRDATYPGIVAGEPETRVAGIVYFNLDDEALARLDTFESDLYEREPVVVTGSDERSWECWAYIVPSRSASLLTDDKWTAEWFERNGLANFLNRYRGFRAD